MILTDMVSNAPNNLSILWPYIIPATIRKIFMTCIFLTGKIIAQQMLPDITQSLIPASTPMATTCEHVMQLMESGPSVRFHEHISSGPIFDTSGNHKHIEFFFMITTHLL